ncbi:MAG: hypothetical protein M3506_04475 [Chloroflexota bacterium]|nr:hypothetical protein [Chloroflexota bacterium]
MRVVGRDPVSSNVQPVPEVARKPGFAEMVLPPTGTRMRVLEVYKGSGAGSISVAQLGSIVAATDDHALMEYAVADHPIFADAGGTCSASNVTDAPGTASGGKPYAIVVNLAGHHDVHGNEVATDTDGLGDYAAPKTVAELTARI